MMSTTTEIEWTDATWNPVTGCTKITRGCDFCYAERFSERFRGVPGHPFENGFDLTLRPERLPQPLHWRQPRRIFVNSMSDLFHKEVPTTFIDAVFDTMEAANWHTYQVLTKRSSLLVRYLRRRYASGLAPPHIWLGVSIEDAQNLVRLNHLRAAKASVKFISFEPLLGPLGTVDLSGIDWVIVGGESGPARGPSPKNGPSKSAINAGPPRLRSFSSSGAGSGQSPADAFFAGANGINIPAYQRIEAWKWLRQCRKTRT